MAQSWEMRKALAERWREKEDSVLIAAGYIPVRGGMWHKSGVLFGREAALQNARAELADRSEPTSTNEA